jgi:hypothetical protein
MNATSKQWQTICDKCATDADEPWIDPHPVLFGAQYRITAFKAFAALWLAHRLPCQRFALHLAMHNA